MTSKMESVTQFDKFKRIVVQSEEEHGCNCVNINGTVLVPSDAPKTREAIEALSLKTIVVENKEFRKLDGALTCMSLRF